MVILMTPRDYLSICLICKDENAYLPEWLDYHILMGVDRFYIYDNESRVSLGATLQDYIQRGWVVVLEMPGKAMQMQAYDHCLQTFGSNTFWLGFIDADEFLVPKTSMDLKALLQEYEAYGGLAVSSLFFGSGGQKEQPAAGQIGGYLWRTHETYPENQLVKCIVRPDRVLLPNSPHDFIFKENAWCVNEDFKRVDYQRFPNYTRKIQLNHYYCRSESELEKKLSRGNAGAVQWPRARFDRVNQHATIQDTTILQNLEKFFARTATVQPWKLEIANLNGLSEQLASVANERSRARLLAEALAPITPRPEFAAFTALKDQILQAKAKQDLAALNQLCQKFLEVFPQHLPVYTDLMWNLLRMGDPQAAWGAVAQAWRLAPNSFFVLSYMGYYFLSVQNFTMVEKTARLMLEIGPSDLHALYFLTEALLGQGRPEEALKVGLPVIEISARLGELPENIEIHLVKKLADYLIQKQDFSAAVHLWRLGVLCAKSSSTAMFELANAHLLNGEISQGRELLLRLQALDPKMTQVQQRLKQLDARPANGKHKPINKKLQ